MDDLGTVAYILIGLGWLIYGFLKKKFPKDKAKGSNQRRQPQAQQEPIIERPKEKSQTTEEFLEKIFGLEDIEESVLAEVPQLPKKKTAPVPQKPPETTYKSEAQSLEEYRQPSYFYEEKKGSEKTKETKKERRDKEILSESSQENEIATELHNELRSTGADLRKGILYHEILRRKEF